LKDQALDLQLSRADVVEISPDQLRRAAQENQRLATSSPAQIIGLVFSEGKNARDVRIRQALSLAIDRTAIRNTLLQGQGEPAADLLPQWCSGYAFLSPVAVDLLRARQLMTEVSAQPPPLTLAYDWSDPLARVVAERIAVNAHDAGLNVQAYGENLAARSANADARMVRVPLMSSDPSAALASLAYALNVDAQKIEAASTPEDLLVAGRAARQGSAFLPIVYVPESYGLSARVRNWSEPREGGWLVADVWVEMQRP
jgi:ABC-type transport system substrate-binding protein